MAADGLFSAATPALLPWAAGTALLFFLGAGWLRFRINKERQNAVNASTVCAWVATVLLFFAWHGHLLNAGPGPALAACIPAQGCVVEAVGIVHDEPTPQARFQVRLESVTLDGKTVQTAAPILVRWTGEPLPQYGDRVRMIGDMHRLAPPRNPGVFDSPRVWQRQGIYAELKIRYANDRCVLAQDCGPPFVARALALRHWMERTMALDLEDSPELVSLIQSMVLGSRGESLADTKKLFQYTGTMHLFAVSGMNIAMLAGMAAWLLQAVGVGRRTMAILVIPLLWVYCYATGLTPSSLRATVMASLALAGFLLDRPVLSWNTLGASTLVLLAWSPDQLFTPGFQLSFGMVAFLMAFARPVQEWLSRGAQPDPFLPRPLWRRTQYWSFRVKKELLGALAVSTIAWIGSMPLTVYYFHMWSPSTIPANIFAVGLAWLMLILGVASVLTGLFWQGLAIIFNNANWLVAKVFLAGITGLASIPGGHVFVEMPSPKPAPFCEVEVLDLPGGAAIHLRTHSGARRDWLVDCGSASAFTYQTAPYLRSRGVNNLDGFVLTHGDSQHIGGAVEVLREMTPAEIVDSPPRDRSSYRHDLHMALEASGRGKTIVARGETLTLAPGVVLRVLFPPEGFRASRADDQAFVLRLDAAGKRILLSSDAGFLTEQWLLENAASDELRCDIWIKQMHAKDLSGTPDFLHAVQPSLVVASSTLFPPEEHLSEEWVAQVEALGIRLLRQDITGAVHIRLEANGTWQAEPFLKIGREEK